MNLFLPIFRYGCGYLRIRLSGDYSERLLNVLSANHLSFWDIKKEAQGYTISIFMRDLSRLRQLRRKTGVHVRLLGQYGAPKIIRRYRLRLGIPVGAVLFFVLLNLLSSRLWIIRVNAPPEYDTTRATAILTELAVSPGMSMDAVDTDTLRQEFILRDRSIAWASLNRQGSVLEVNITLQSQQTREDTVANNLVALSDGVIVRSEVRTGILLVQNGQTVCKGQVLVSGVSNAQGRNEFSHSAGEVYAQVVEDHSVSLPVKETVYRPAGTPKNRYALRAFSVTVPLFLGSLHGPYDRVTTQKQITFFGGEIPFTLYCQSNTPLEACVVERNEETALIDGRATMMQGLSEFTDPTVLRESVTKQGDTYLYTCRIRYTKNIAKVEKLKIIGEN